MSKEQNSFLFDVAWQLGIVINGQLLLTYLTEKIFEKIPDTFIIFENTDGILVKIPKKDLHHIDTICKEVEAFSKIGLEYETCDQVIVRNVNNYINIIDKKKNKVKVKGVFEVDKDWHKDHSMRIVPLAIANYFINGVTPEQTLKYHHTRTSYPELILDGDKPIQAYGIFDYCKRIKIKGKDRLISNQHHVNVVEERDEQKMTRYYISNEGSQLIKIMPPLKSRKGEMDKYRLDIPNQLELFDIDDYKKIPDRRSEIEAGHLSTVFNKFEKKEFEKYDIKDSYYLEECWKVIHSIIK